MIIQLIFHISSLCCSPDPHWRQRPDGAEWDTIKPLKLHGLDMRRTILIDNEAHKAYGHETANMVLMPEWSGQPGASCCSCAACAACCGCLTAASRANHLFFCVLTRASRIPNPVAGCWGRGPALRHAS